MSAIRSLLIRTSCALILVSALVLPGATRAASNGVPPINGNWAGKVSDVYWDQTSPGAVHPKKKFKSKVTVTIAQTNDQVTITINFVDPFPLNSSAFISQVVLGGYAGNYHVNAAMDAGPAVTLSGIANKNGTRLTLNGVAASTEFTHEMVIKLTKQNP